MAGVHFAFGDTESHIVVVVVGGTLEQLGSLDSGQQRGLNVV